MDFSRLKSYGLGFFSRAFLRETADDGVAVNCVCNKSAMAIVAGIRLCACAWSNIRNNICACSSEKVSGGSLIKGC